MTRGRFDDIQGLADRIEKSSLKAHWFCRMAGVFCPMANLTNLQVQRMKEKLGWTKGLFERLKGFFGPTKDLFERLRGFFGTTKGLFERLRGFFGATKGLFERLRGFFEWLKVGFQLMKKCFQWTEAKSQYSFNQVNHSSRQDESMWEGLG